MTRARTYQFGRSQLSIRFGDIVAAEAQVIVSSDDYYITMGGGVSAAILNAGGSAIPLDAAKKVPAPLGDVVVSDEEVVRKALAENQELRLQYLNELQSFIAKAEEVSAVVRSTASLTVFVRSTSLDLVAHRTAVKDAIARCDLFFRGMEHFGAEPNGLPPAKLIVEEVRKADVYLGVFGCGTAALIRRPVCL